MLALNRFFIVPNQQSVMGLTEYPSCRWSEYDFSLHHIRLTIQRQTSGQPLSGPTRMARWSVAGSRAAPLARGDWHSTDTRHSAWHGLIGGGDSPGFDLEALSGSAVELIIGWTARPSCDANERSPAIGPMWLIGWFDADVVKHCAVQTSTAGRLSCRSLGCGISAFPFCFSRLAGFILSSSFQHDLLNALNGVGLLFIESLEILFFNKLRQRQLPGLVLVIGVFAERIGIHTQFTRHLNLSICQAVFLPGANPACFVLRNEILLGHCRSKPGWLKRKNPRNDSYASSRGLLTVYCARLLTDGRSSRVPLRCSTDTGRHRAWRSAAGSSDLAVRRIGICSAAGGRRTRGRSHPVRSQFPAWRDPSPYRCSTDRNFCSRHVGRLRRVVPVPSLRGTVHAQRDCSHTPTSTPSANRRWPPQLTSSAWFPSVAAITPVAVGGVTNPIAASIRLTHISAVGGGKPENPYGYCDRFSGNNPFVLQSLPDRGRLTFDGGHGWGLVFSLQVLDS